MVNQKLFGYGLVLLALALLAAGGRLDMLALLLPVSVVAGLGMARLHRKRTRLMDEARIRLPRVAQ